MFVHKIISQVMFQWNDKPKATSSLWSGKLYCNISLQKRKLCSNSNKVSCLGQFRERNFLLSFLLSFFYPSQLTQILVNSTKKASKAIFSNPRWMSRGETLSHVEYRSSVTFTICNDMGNILKEGSKGMQSFLLHCYSLILHRTDNGKVQCGCRQNRGRVAM